MTATAQNMEALAYANEVRAALAEFKRTVRNLPTRPAAELVVRVLESGHDDTVKGHLRIRPLLLCINGLGEHKMTRCLAKAGVVNFDKRVRDLSQRQRDSIALQVHLWAGGYPWGHH